MIKTSKTQLHFVGIGGIGMSGIAEVFLNQGYRVSGSDLLESETTKRLVSLGARIFFGHKTQNIQGASVVVISSAVKADNPEVVAAREKRIPVIPRAEMLGELMRGKTGIAVGGTHGKTTTTSMLAAVMTSAGMDPTLVVGGKVNQLGTNAKLGAGSWVVAEADESDGSFLHLPATFAVVTNIDTDHLDHFGSLQQLEQAFVDFVGKLPFYGVAALCLADAGVRRCLPRMNKPILTYGWTPDCDYFATDVEPFETFGSQFNVHQRLSDHEDRVLGAITIRVPGKHNVMNALAAIALGSKMGLDFVAIQKGLAEFRGVKRRFELKFQNTQKSVLVIDDYGHHPTEVAATIAAARSHWTGKLHVVFQPHRYSRTMHCHNEFLTAFKDADTVLITDIYAAGEEPIPGVTAEGLANAIGQLASANQVVRHVGTLENALNESQMLCNQDDLLLCLGAGTITKFSDQISERLIEKFKT